jgi:acetate kinase
VRVLTVNAGSSSLKLALVEEGERVADDEIASRGGQFAPDELARFAQQGFDCSSHRVVHGGPRFTRATVIDDGVRAALEDLVDLAPLHTRAALTAIDSVRELDPERPAVACFDTSFHATLPEAARTYALPWKWNEEYSLRRYGFHGLNHGYVARRAAEVLRRPLEELRLVSCHLGAGASLCAIAGGRSVDTTMGFTPLEGLVMATRSGSVDPGLLLWLLERTEMSERELAGALEHDSGLLGLAGSADMREVLAGATDGDQRARLALDVYLHRLRGGIASMAAALGGLDALVFTGGVGEHSPEIRSGAAAGLGFLGVDIDDSANADGEGDRDISDPAADVRTLLVQAREDVEIASQTRQVLQ